jgi:peptide/nickel transport system substrate-binding protein
VFFQSCSGDSASKDKTNVFRYNEHSDITSLDPAFAKDQRNIWAVNQLYNTLVGLDKDMNIIPELANSWDISEDGMVYTFNLRDNVYFHEYSFIKNRTVTADDVVFSLKRLTDPNLASPGSWTMNKVKSITALDDLTVQIQLKTNFPAFLGVLTMKYCSVLPSEVSTGQIDFRENPIGTGPFYFKKWIPKEKLVFRKNNLYFERDSTGISLPYFEAISITFLPDKQSEFLQFVQGNLDFVNGLDISYKDELLNAEGELDDKYKSFVEIEKIMQLNTEYVGYNLRDENYSVHHKDFRKAINYAIDKQKMIKYLRNGIGTPASQGFVPPSLLNAKKVKGYSYSPELAIKHLNQFKALSGISNPSLTISTNPSYVDLIELMQSDLKKIGIELEIDVMPPSTLRQKRSKGELEAFRASWIADYPDAENYLSLFYSKNKTPNGPNYTFFDSKTYDSLYNIALSSTNMDKRLSSYQMLDSIVIEEAAVIPLFYDQVVRFKHKSLKNFTTNSINMLDLKHAYKN